MKEYFPIFNQEQKNLIYLDSAATMQMPQVVMDRIAEFYALSNANVGRGSYALGEHASQMYEDARGVVAEFIGATSPDEIIFTSGATAGINMVARFVEQMTAEEHLSNPTRSKGQVLITQMEHHSNYLPWVELCHRTGLELVIAKVQEDGQLDLEDFMSKVNQKTRIVSFTEVSNVTGIRNPVKEMIAKIRAKSRTLILVDGAQGVVHGRISMKECDPDFYVFSGHKLGAPTGTGVLYMKEELQDQFAPVSFGGGIIDSVTPNQIVYKNGPSKFEPGTPNYTGVIGLVQAIEFYQSQEAKIGYVDFDALISGNFNMSAMSMDLLEMTKNMCQREIDMLEELEEELSGIPGIHVMAQGQKHYGCLSFAVGGLSAYDVSKMLDSYGILLRSGHLCAQPYVNALGYDRLLRVSLGMYSEKSDLQALVDALKEILYEYEAIESFGTKQSYLDLPIEEADQKICEELDQMSDHGNIYLARLADKCLGIPKYLNTDSYKIDECKFHVTMVHGYKENGFVLYADSDTRTISGVISLIQRLLIGRDREEITGYRLKMLEHGLVKDALDPKLINTLSSLTQL